MKNESVGNVLLVIISLCLVCSVVVASTAVLMRPFYEANKIADMNRNILQVAGLYNESASVEESFDKIVVRYLDLDTHRLLETLPDELMEKDDRDLSRDEDVANIQSLESVVKVFLVYDDAQSLEQIILPIRGYGLWSTLHGFISVNSDGTTVRGLQFYDHKETPGLGGEVDNPAWRKQWGGKRLYDEDGKLQLHVTKGRVDGSDARAQYKVDGLAGATLTSRGVTNMLKFWFSEEVYGALMKEIASSRA